MRCLQHSDARLHIHNTAISICAIIPLFQLDRCVFGIRPFLCMFVIFRQTVVCFALPARVSLELNVHRTKSKHKQKNNRPNSQICSHRKRRRTKQLHQPQTSNQYVQYMQLPAETQKNDQDRDR